MSAAILREAATAIRSDHGETWQESLPETPFFIALATWLDVCAEVCEAEGKVVTTHALAAAIAYLRTEAAS